MCTLSNIHNFTPTQSTKIKSSDVKVLSRPIYRICTARNIIMAQFLSMKKSASRMLLNPRIVFTFTRQRWSTTFSSYLALLMWRSNIHIILHPPTSFIRYIITAIPQQTYICWFILNMYVGLIHHCFDDSEKTCVLFFGHTALFSVSGGGLTQNLGPIGSAW